MIVGSNFWQGFTTGFTGAAFNHFIHDISQKSYEIIYAHDTEGVSYFGHAAILIQIAERTYTYYSKTVHNDGNGNAIVDKIPGIKSLADFKKSSYGQQYDKFALFKSTLSQNNAVIASIQDLLNTKYNVLSNNCYHMVSVGFKAANLWVYPSNVPNDSIGPMMIYARDNQRINSINPKTTYLKF